MSVEIRGKDVTLASWGLVRSPRQQGRGEVLNMDTEMHHQMKKQNLEIIRTNVLYAEQLRKLEERKMQLLNEIFLLNSKIIAQNSEIQALKTRVELLENQSKIFMDTCNIKNLHQARNILSEMQYNMLRYMSSLSTTVIPCFQSMLVSAEISESSGRNQRDHNTGEDPRDNLDPNIHIESNAQVNLHNSQPDTRCPLDSPLKSCTEDENSSAAKTDKERNKSRNIMPLANSKPVNNNASRNISNNDASKPLKGGARLSPSAPADETENIRMRLKRRHPINYTLPSLKRKMRRSQN